MQNETPAIDRRSLMREALRIDSLMKAGYRVTSGQERLFVLAILSLPHMASRLQLTLDWYYMHHVIGGPDLF